MDLRLASFALVALVALASGCSYRAHVGAHDAGVTGSCTLDSDCAAGNQCACGRCITLDLPAPACDPGCDAAEHGDFCTVEGRRCPTGPCSELVCRMGVMQLDEGLCGDGGICSCAAPPPGCYYEDLGCPCSGLICPGEPCGRTTCGEGTVCCNASCGVCAPPDVACSAVACAPDCSPQDAQGDGLCARTLDIWAWNGAACRALSGCSTCEGADCANTFATQAACEAAFSECGRACGGRLGSSCGPDEYCDFPEPHLCGATDEMGVCRPNATECTWESRTVCGCDGITYLSPCDAYHNGTDFLQDGPCAPSCEPDDARGTGACDLVLGVVWTGTRCEYISGCSCEGTDCETILRDETACNAAHADCIVPHG